jgi:hypothetical protein
MAIAAETERMMRNWARWKTGAPIGLAVSSAYELEGRGRREEAPIPLLNGEAMDVDKAVLDLPGELFQVVEQHWLKRGTVKDKARRCHCSEATFYRRLDDAHARVHIFLDANRERHRRLAAHDARARLAPRCTRCGELHWLREPCAQAEGEPLSNPLYGARGSA